MKYGMDPQEDSLKSGALPEEPRMGRRSRSIVGNAGAGRAASQKVKTEAGDYPGFYAELCAMQL